MRSFIVRSLRIGRFAGPILAKWRLRVKQERVPSMTNQAFAQHPHLQQNGVAIAVG